MNTETKTVRTLKGIVVSNKGNKTIVVRVDRIEPHRVYGKVVRRSTKLHAHDENNVCNIGDLVSISESRPISKMKAWMLQEVLQTAVE
jgi:small subunit ribosomal protein S17